MIHLFIVIALSTFLIILVRARLVQIDLFFPWFVSLVILGLLSTQPMFVNWIGEKLGILYPPIAVLFLVIFLLIGIVVTLTISVTRLRERQASLARHLAEIELSQQEGDLEKS